jgi:uncharacterized protein
LTGTKTHNALRIDPRIDELVAHLRPVVATALAGRSPAHDVLHVERVAALAERIALTESDCEVRVVVAAAWLHEQVNLPKSHPQSAESGTMCAAAAQSQLLALAFPPEFAARVAQCIAEHAFSKGAAATSLESCILQDADRLDAIGALGIARCFATASDMQVPFYDREDPRAELRALDDKQFALDHFARKLLKLRDGFHTEAARQLATARHAVLEAFLTAFYRELAESSSAP